MKNRIFLWVLLISFLIALTIPVMLRYFTSILILLFLILLCFLIIIRVSAIRKGELVEVKISKEIKPITKQRITRVATVAYSVGFEYGRSPRLNVKVKRVFFFQKNAERFIGQKHTLAYYFCFNKRSQLVLKEGLVRNILLNCLLVIPMLIYLIIFFFPYTVDTISGIIDFFG